MLYRKYIFSFFTFIVLFNCFTFNTYGLSGTKIHTEIHPSIEVDQFGHRYDYLTINDTDFLIAGASSYDRNLVVQFSDGSIMEYQTGTINTIDIIRKGQDYEIITTDQFRDSFENWFTIFSKYSLISKDLTLLDSFTMNEACLQTIKTSKFLFLDFREEVRVYDFESSKISIIMLKIPYVKFIKEYSKGEILLVDARGYFFNIPSNYKYIDTVWIDSPEYITTYGLVPVYFSKRKILYIKEGKISDYKAIDKDTSDGFSEFHSYFKINDREFVVTDNPYLLDSSCVYIYEFRRGKLKLKSKVNGVIEMPPSLKVDNERVFVIHETYEEGDYVNKYYIMEILH